MEPNSLTSNDSTNRWQATPDLHEVKQDGYQTAARIDRGELRLLTRTSLDRTDRHGAGFAADR
jgi:ATP-dependent DNA ligase